MNCRPYWQKDYFEKAFQFEPLGQTPSTPPLPPPKSRCSHFLLEDTADRAALCGFGVGGGQTGGPGLDLPTRMAKGGLLFLLLSVVQQ